MSKPLLFNLCIAALDGSLNIMRKATSFSFVAAKYCIAKCAIYTRAPIPSLRNITQCLARDNCACPFSSVPFPSILGWRAMRIPYHIYADLMGTDPIIAANF